MSPRDYDRRDARIAELRAKPVLTVAEHAELDRLVGCMDQHWRNLPRQIASACNKLFQLEARAAAIGLGPV